jgi:site-specific DNA-methyltransferase (adenine-specific)
MFSFTGDTVLDPFCGTGTTMIAAMKTGRSSIGVEIDPAYVEQARSRLERENHSLFGDVEFVCEANRVSEGVVKYRRAGQRRSKPTRSDVGLSRFKT